MAWTQIAWTAIILVALVFLSLPVVPMSMPFLILLAIICRLVVAAVKKIRIAAVERKRRCSILPITSPAVALADGAMAPIVAAASGMRRQPEPSSISSSLSGFKYDVYLSFHGPDTRNGIVSHIYTKLADAGIRVFRDDDRIVGKEIYRAIKEAMKQSRILIPFFSRNYSSSNYCLYELVQMWESMKLNGQTVFPIFYELSPDDVRHHIGHFEESFHRLKAEELARCDSNAIEAWREVLRQIGDSKGYLWQRNGPDSRLVNEVFAGVVRVFTEDDQVVTDKLVGIDHHVEEMMKKLGVVYSDGQTTEVRGEEVRVVGVCGERGVGKTTLAKVVFNKARKCFNACIFLEGIASKGVQVSRRWLIAGLQIRKPEPLDSSGEEIEEMASLFQNVKVLIVLDGVDKDEQIRALAGDLAWFGPGSRIIVTTTKTKVLNAFDKGAVEKHPVQPMDREDAHKLFCKHAFQGYAAPDVSEYYSLSTAIAKAIGGLPSDIVRQASSLRNDMKIDRWETTLKLLSDKKRKK